MRLGALVVLALTLVASALATTRSGLHGTVMRGPVAPVCTSEQPCSVPAGGATLVFLRNGREVARAKTSANGSYRIVLAPGLYSVSAGKRPLDPGTVRIRRGRMLRVDFSIDTGIRYPAAVTASGLRGVVKQGPTSPVCVAGTPCDGLARGVTLVFARRGHLPVRAKTRGDGTYRVRLVPGRYSVRVAGNGGVGGVKPSVVGVPAGRFVRVNFFVDTGIRGPAQP